MKILDDFDQEVLHGVFVEGLTKTLDTLTQKLERIALEDGAGLQEPYTQELMAYLVAFKAALIENPLVHAMISSEFVRTRMDRFDAQFLLKQNLHIDMENVAWYRGYNTGRIVNLIGWTMIDQFVGWGRVDK